MWFCVRDLQLWCEFEFVWVLVGGLALVVRCISCLNFVG